MEYIIAPVLFQQKSCRIPGIGTLSLEQGITSVDFINSKLLRSLPVIRFKLETGEGYGYNEFTALGQMIRKELDVKGQMVLAGIGTFSKKLDGNISFDPISLRKDYFPEVAAERVIRLDATHTILVGDKETDSVVMTEFYAEKPRQRDYWRLWSLLLACLGIGTLVFYIYRYGWHLLSSQSLF